MKSGALTYRALWLRSLHRLGCTTGVQSQHHEIEIEPT
jgi:hypothetical protein